MVLGFNLPCYTPLHGYEGSVGSNGKRSTVWSVVDSDEGVRRKLPCGKCVGCRLERSRQWAGRCMHESSRHSDNSFVTLTFDNDHLPDDGSLNVRHLQLFMKRLRKRFGPVRFFAAGEYGGKLGRPHYHLLLFGLDFKDKVLFKITEREDRIWMSKSLSEVWPFGNHYIGSVTFASAAYVARYVMKKVVGVGADEHYVNRSNGVLLRPEFIVMSRNPGIGSSWFGNFKSDVYPSDQLIFSGREYRPPRYYDNLLDKEDPDLMESIRSRRREACKFVDDGRLRVMEQVKQAQIGSLRRNLE